MALLHIVFIITLMQANYPDIKKQKIKEFTKITHFNSIAFSSISLESRNILIDDYSNNLYLQMKNHNYKEFVYDK